MTKADPQHEPTIARKMPAERLLEGHYRVDLPLNLCIGRRLRSRQHGPNRLRLEPGT